MRANILINKEIIENFVSHSNQKDKYKLIESKYKEENQKLYQSNEELNKKLQLTHSKMGYIEQTLSEAFHREKEENETLKSKIFFLEQSIQKKNSIIFNYKKRKEDKDNDEEYEREVYVFDPTKAIVQINDELLMYKQIYDSLIPHIKDIRESLSKSELMISDLQKENSKLRLQYKYHMLTANREKETLINAIQYERTSSNNRHLTDNCAKQDLSQTNTNANNLSNNNTGITNPNICRTDIVLTDLQIYKKLKMKTIDKTKFENEEFMEILKSNNLSQGEFEKLSKTKSNSRLIEVIEMLYSLLKDKNMSLNLLREEIDKLTTKNFQLNKDNMVLFQQNIEFKKQPVNSKAFLVSKNDQSNYADSLLNNTSQKTTNHNISNAITTYHKFIKLEEKKDTEIYTDSFERERESEHDSIVYMKNIREYSNDINENTTNVSKDKRISSNNNTTATVQRDININKNIMTMESITSSEFREGFKESNSFISTIREAKCDKDNVDGKDKEKGTDLDMVKIKSPNE